MPQIANRAQQVYTGGVYPISAYSRVVSLQLSVEFGAGAIYSYTPSLGNKLWLLEIQLSVREKPVNKDLWTSVYVSGGIGTPTGPADIVAWDNVLPNYDETRRITNWVFYDGQSYMSWRLSKLYEGKQLRFAMIASRDIWGKDVVRASFRIAEG